MRRWTIVGIVAGTAALALVGGCLTLLPRDGRVPEGLPTAAPEGPEWVDLLDEAYAGHWRNVSDDRRIFEITDGELHIFGRYPLRYIGYMAEPFGDLELHVEYKLTRGANSGVFFRADPEDPVQRGFEIQVLDDHGRPPHKNRTGAIYNVVTPMYNMSRPAGEWNSFDIRVEGRRVEVAVNGWKVVDADLGQMTMPIGKFETPLAELPLEGYLMLQDHGGEVWYRNLLVRKLNGD